MNQGRKIRQMALTGFFLALQIVMTVTRIGYIPLGPINITTMHIPVIIAGIFLGSASGAAVGFVFGLTSMLMATFTPGPTSFIFSPFITVGGISGNFGSLVICFVPRILLGWISGWLFRLLRRRFGVNDLLACGISAAVSTMLHTLMVMGLIWLIFAPSYAQALGIPEEGIGAVILGVITTNGVLETIAAAVIVPVLDKALWPIVRRMRLGV